MELNLRTDSRPKCRTGARTSYLCVFVVPPSSQTPSPGTPVACRCYWSSFGLGLKPESYRLGFRLPRATCSDHYSTEPQQSYRRSEKTSMKMRVFCANK